MLKSLFARFRRDRGIPQATVRIDFSQYDQVSSSLIWHRPPGPQNDTVVLAVHFYARILYELAELNEGRVAKELLSFMDQVCRLIMADSGTAPQRPQLPLGEVSLTAELPNPAVRTYRAEFQQLRDGGFRLEFQGSLGKEGFYLPAAFLAFLQVCVNELPDEALLRLARAIGRLHDYYRVRRDFWDSMALKAGPAFALGTEELPPGEAVPET